MKVLSGVGPRTKIARVAAEERVDALHYMAWLLVRGAVKRDGGHVESFTGGFKVRACAGVAEGARPCLSDWLNERLFLHRQGRSHTFVSTIRYRDKHLLRPAFNDVLSASFSFADSLVLSCVVALPSAAVAALSTHSVDQRTSR